MSIAFRKIIEFLEKETGKNLKKKRYKISSGKEGDAILSFYKEKPFILKGIKKEWFYQFVNIVGAMKVDKFLIAAKVIERNTYYLVDVGGIYVYGIKKTYVCEGNGKLIEEGKFLKYKVYRVSGRDHYYVIVNMEVVLNKKGVDIRMSNGGKEKISMEEYFYILEDYDNFKEKIFEEIEEIRKEFEERSLSKDYLTMTKKEIAISIMKNDENFKYRAWYCSRKKGIPKICQNPFAYKAVAIYEQYYQAMKKLQVLVFPKEAEIPNEQ